jgi:hypothetical protein
MVGKRTYLKQKASKEPTIDTKYIRRSARNAQKNVIAMSDHSIKLLNISVASDVSSVSSVRSERKRKEVSEEVTDVSPSKVNSTNRVTTIPKKLKSTQAESSVDLTINVRDSRATNQDTIASQVVSTTAQPKKRGRPPKNPQVTTTMQQSNQPKRRGRPPKMASTVVRPATDSVESTLAKQSRKRENHAVEKDHKTILRPKRRKGDTFTSPIPSRPQKIGLVYAIGSNEAFQCGVEDSDVAEVTKLSIIKSLDQFDIVDISAGSLHNAALTVDGKVVTWGCNDHGKLIIKYL